MWLVMSDTHDNIPVLKKIVRLARERGVSAVFHAGDFIAPFVVPYILDIGVPFYGVFGNNDGERLFMRQKAGDAIQVGPREIETPYGMVVLMHEPFALRAAEASGLYRFVFYGHTHRVDIRRVGDTLVLNPGEACGYLTGKATVALVNPETMEVELVEVADVDR